LHALAPVLEHRQGVDRAAAAKGVLLPGRRLTRKTSQQVLEELPSPIATTEDINNGNLLPAAGSPTCCGEFVFDGCDDDAPRVDAHAIKLRST
jgi:hypothetical protein